MNTIEPSSVTVPMLNAAFFTSEAAERSKEPGAFTSDSMKKTEE